MAPHPPTDFDLVITGGEVYPDAFNPYDSLGEAYMADGQNELARTNYEKSLELNPDNTNAAQMLQKLGVKP